MLNEKELDWLVDQLAATSELLGQQLSVMAAAMLAEDLAAYSRPVLSAALKRIRTEHTGKLTLKAIIECIDAAMGRPSSNEAWAGALLALDERNTVVWTEEMAQAWSVAQPLATGGDLIGARMAFKDAYDRLVRTAREERRTPVVSVSIGWDAAGRTAPVEQAVKLGYMPPNQAHQYLSAPAAPGVVALLMHNGEISSEMPPQIREKLLELRDDLAAGRARRAAERAARAISEAADLAARKALAQEMADSYPDPAAALRKAEWAAAGVAA
jgi:hypothetical protein